MRPVREIKVEVFRCFLRVGREFWVGNSCKNKTVIEDQYMHLKDDPIFYNKESIFRIKEKSDLLVCFPDMPMMHLHSREISLLLNGRTRTATFTEDIFLASAMTTNGINKPDKCYG